LSDTPKDNPIIPERGLKTFLLTLSALQRCNGEGRHDGIIVKR